MNGDGIELVRIQIVSVSSTTDSESRTKDSDKKYKIPCDIDYTDCLSTSFSRSRCAVSMDIRICDSIRVI